MHLASFAKTLVFKFGFKPKSLFFRLNQTHVWKMFMFTMLLP